MKYSDSECRSLIQSELCDDDSELSYVEYVRTSTLVQMLEERLCQPVSREEIASIVKQAANGPYEPQKGIALACAFALFDEIERRGIA